MLKVLNVITKTDKFGKLYKYITFHSPEQKIKLWTLSGIIERVASSKTCGYVAYPINYSQHQGSDPYFDLQIGDTLEGRIVTKKVNPTIVNGDLVSRCSVPVFCSDNDPIEFEIELVKAFKRAGKTLEKNQLRFGEELSSNIEFSKIPEKCLIVQTIN